MIKSQVASLFRDNKIGWMYQLSCRIFNHYGECIRFEFERVIRIGEKKNYIPIFVAIEKEIFVNIDSMGE